MQSALWKHFCADSRFATQPGMHLETGGAAVVAHTQAAHRWNPRAAVGFGAPPFSRGSPPSNRLALSRFSPCPIALDIQRGEKNKQTRNADLQPDAARQEDSLRQGGQAPGPWAGCCPQKQRYPASLSEIIGLSRVLKCARLLSRQLQLVSFHRRGKCLFPAISDWVMSLPAVTSGPQQVPRKLSGSPP